MKNFKRIFTLALALMMVLSLATTAFAATSNITFQGGAEGAEYSAYRLLDATDGGEGKLAYTLNAKYADILKAETGKTEEADVIDTISKLDAAGIRAFANDVYAAIVAAGIAADATTTTDAITGANQGYYLIAETKLGTYPNGATDTFSLVMIDTVGDANVTITTKESVPTVDKEVWNLNDSTGENHWGEHADYDIGDKVPFRITTTVSGRYDEYINYWYEIGDTMDAGLTYNDDLVIMLGTTNVTEKFTITATDSGFTATANLKEWTDVTVTHNSKFILTYSATLNEDAVSGVPGNKNKATLKFQNDPYDLDDPEEPGTTPPDVTIVFTYDAIVNKIDNNGNALEGAGFTLYKWNNEANAWVAVGSEIKGEKVVTFRFDGLDKGIYKLVETTVPEGYNKADDIEFHIHPVYDTTKDPVVLTELNVVNRDGDLLTNFNINMEPGEITTNIVNNAGAELPETGGMGTTLFYIFGTVMVLGAAVLLITKKRMAV